MSDYYQVKNQNIFNPPANTYLGNATNQFNSVYVQNDLVLGNVTVTGSTIVAPKVSTITYPGDDTAADTAGGQTITLTGAGFVVGASVLINGSAVSVVSVVSSTTITFTSPANSTGSYVIYVINPDGSTAIAIPGIQYSGTPNWTTAAGSLGNVYETASFNQTVTATGDAPITYSVYSGTLPPGATFNSNGTISGTSQLLSSPTTYTFTIRATDAQQQDTNRSFSLTVTPDVVTWSNPTDNTTYSPAANVAMANITLSATSAVGSGITYSANTLPTGLSLTGANISGTPTVAANTSSLLTATANTTSESSSITINWVVSVASDPYFMYNTLLLSGNGTNNANNNTFVDGSTNNFTITRNGNTTQGTFSPYGSNWSNYFDGTGDYLTTPATGQFAPTGDFTISFWYYPTVLVNYGTPIGNYTASTPNDWLIESWADGTLKFYAAGGSASVASAAGALKLGQWHYISMSRSGTTITGYINGVSQGTSTLSGTFGSASKLISIGALPNGTSPITGYISDVKLLNGFANTSVPTAPQTVTTGTSLLTCQSNRLIDNSTNNFTITKNGNVSVQRFSPYSPSASYSTSAIGGSGYFDGTGDYLSFNPSTTFAFGTGDFTVEGWIYPTISSTEYSLFDATTNGAYWSLRFTASSIYYQSASGQANKIVATNVLTDKNNSWFHVAIVRLSGISTLYLNGVSVGSTSDATNYSTATTYMMGKDSDGYYFTGYISNARVVKGTAVYTSAFTPPTAPVTAITNTSILLNFTNTGIFDNTMMNDLETVGDAKISTAQSKFGGGSMSFDGSGDWLFLPSNTTLALGSGDFTVEMWMYPNLTYGSTYAGLLDSRTNADGAGLVYFGYTGTANQIGWKDNTTNVVTGTVTQSTWNHVAVVRSSGTMKLYINGTSVSTGSNSTNYTVPFKYIATSFDPFSFNGYIDDLRITKGYARYTSNFTAPTSAFPTY